jgi:HSP20 family molecular chaperone IbpA
VRFEDGRVHVRIDRFREFHEGFEMQFPGRGLTLHGTVDLSETPVRAAQSTAELKDNGTLHVRVPKADEEFDSETDDTSSDNGTAADDTGRDGETAIDDT